MNAPVQRRNVYRLFSAESSRPKQPKATLRSGLGSVETQAAKGKEWIHSEQI